MFKEVKQGSLIKMQRAHIGTFQAKPTIVFKSDTKLFFPSQGDSDSKETLDWYTKSLNENTLPIHLNEIACKSLHFECFDEIKAHFIKNSHEESITVSINAQITNIDSNLTSFKRCNFCFKALHDNEEGASYCHNCSKTITTNANGFVLIVKIFLFS